MEVSEIVSVVEALVSVILKLVSASQAQAILDAQAAKQADIIADAAEDLKLG